MRHLIKKTPFLGSPQTVNLIFKAALQSQNHYIIRQLVESICKNVRSKDYLSELLAICHFVCAKTRYMRDPLTIELVKAPWLVAETIIKGNIPQLDCDDITAFLAALLLAAGFRIRIVTVAFRHAFYQGERQYSHVFIQAYEPRSKTWVTLDPVAGEQTKKMLGRVAAAKVYNLE